MTLENVETAFMNLILGLVIGVAIENINGYDWLSIFWMGLILLNVGAFFLINQEDRFFKEAEK